MNCVFAPDSPPTPPGSTGRRHGRTALPARAAPPLGRWQGWLQRIMAPVLLAGILLPAAGTQSLAASSDPGTVLGGGVAQQQQPPAPPQPAPPSGGTVSGKSFEDLSPQDLYAQPQYAQVKAEWDKQYKPTQGIEIRIPAVNYTAAGGLDTPLKPEDFLLKVNDFAGRPGPALIWKIDDGWVEWTFNVPQTGLYEIDLEYYPIVPQSCDGCIDKKGPIQRDLYLDGQLPFREATRIVFERVWKDAYWPPKRDNQGNDVRPPQVEAPDWERKTIEDADGRYEEPFQFLLTEGQHTLRLQTVLETMAMGDIIIHSPTPVPTYQERLAEWRAKGYKEVTGDVKVKVQAELTYEKSDPTVRDEVNYDALADPYSEGLFRLNSFGWWRWRLAGQWVRWKITVPQDGLYQISLDAWQGWSGRRPRLRYLKIDGQTPFKEMQSILFRTGRDWRLETLRENQSPDGKPYLFYLTKGEHVIQMGVTLGFMAETVRKLDDTLSEMSILSRQMLMITGAHPDPNMEWDLHEKIPDLLPRLQKIVDDLETEAKRMEDIGRAKNDASSAFRVVEAQVRTMVTHPHDIHRMLDDFERSQGILASWLLNLQNHPLAIEWIMVHSPDAKLPRVKANVLEQAVASVKTFLMSFVRDYTSLGSVYEKGGDKTIEVWVGRGSEWGQIMKDMAEDDFTPNTGIRVNIHVIPPAQIGEGGNSVLLLATTAGEAPDVAVGVPSQLPVDFAVRKGLVNLSDFPDYPQIAARFRPGALVPFRYTLPGMTKEGNWAIPETQDFAMLFYRTDVLNQLDIKPPDTWDDVYDALLKLQQNGLDFFYPPPTGVNVSEGSVGFTPFLFQNGGDYYRCNAEHSCRSALDTPEALRGFQEWTDLYTNYKIPQQANFFTRMRTGEQPIGVSGYNTYISLSVAAPELTGRWEMRPMPGHRCGVSVAGQAPVPCPNDPTTGQPVPAGTVIRTSGGTGQSMVIFAQSKQKDAAWEFIKWWSSKDAQQRFGNELEALIGVEARWNTANLEALRALPWPKKDIASIMEQWRWFKEPPVVLGGYFTPRHILNAWNRVVLQGMNPRESLEEAVYDINRELATKQEEFGIKVDPSMYRRGG